MVNKMNSIFPKISCFVVFNFLMLSCTLTAGDGGGSGRASIAFSTVGRSYYAFDIYALPTSGKSTEIRLTDGKSVNFNGYFPPSAAVSMLGILPNRSDPATHLIYVSERLGGSEIYLETLYGALPRFTGSRSMLEAPTESTRFQTLIAGDDLTGGQVSMKDKPTLVGNDLIYISTHENPGKPRTSWTAVYSTHLPTGSTRRLTPRGIADFSPAVSPSGAWAAVASYGEKGWNGDVAELGTDIYVFRTRDGSNRVKIIEHGGWPSWADDSTLYFHRKCDDGWWSVFRAVLHHKAGELGVNSVTTERVTPAGFHAFTPAAKKNSIVIGTHRPDSEYRHVELYDVVSKKFTYLTRPVTPNAHHYNPFFSPDSTWVGYHRCRGASGHDNRNDYVLENVRSPLPDISLFRVGGDFPSYSPDGKRIAFVAFPGLYVMNSDGSGVRKVFNPNAFATAWDWKRNGVVYTSAGPDFAGVSMEVNIISINVDDLSIKQLTTNSANNAFPSPSPDGKSVVFRSGRSGHKNLYIMDAESGESGQLFQLTSGPWTDTMCNWSPDGEWIAFASDRENPGSGNFELFKINPNGTGLRKVMQSGLGGRTNHPWFSHDGKHIVVTSDYAGVSAEPISLPHHWQPYGDIFVINADGSGIRRMTHNSYEDGTPSWSPKYVVPDDVEWPFSVGKCGFADCHWLRISGNGKVQCGK